MPNTQPRYAWFVRPKTDAEMQRTAFLFLICSGALLLSSALSIPSPLPPVYVLLRGCACPILCSCKSPSNSLSLLLPSFSLVLPLHLTVLRASISVHLLPHSACCLSFLSRFLCVAGALVGRCLFFALLRVVGSGSLALERSG